MNALRTAGRYLGPTPCLLLIAILVLLYAEPASRWVADLIQGLLDALDVQ